jgi:hypothetical protein
MNKDKIIKILKENCCGHDDVNDFCTYSNDTIIDIAEEIHKLYDNQWISVDDRLPEMGSYLIHNIRDEELNGSEIAWAFFNSDKKWANPSCGFYYKVTHWMPLPNPPKKEEDET